MTRMSASADFAAYCAELMAPMGEVRTKRMFGGWGIYLDDAFIAIVVVDTLYLKADDTSRPEFEAAGCSCFTYEAKGKVQSMGYWTVPPEAMDSPAAMEPWARLAQGAAMRAKAPKPRTRR